MPILLPASVAPPAPPIVTPPPTEKIPVTVEFRAPNGDILPLAGSVNQSAHMLQGVSGLGAVPREVTRQAIQSGGGYGRHVYAPERLIALPIYYYDNTRDGFREYRQRVISAFLSTTPPNQPPREGVLHFVWSNGAVRELSVVYLDGLTGDDSDGRGITYDLPVLQLLALDPWVYGVGTVPLEFAYAEESNYLNPYETVSADTALGSQTIPIVGHVPVSPVWKVTGPATETSVSVADGPEWTLGEIEVGETITIDTNNMTVRDQTGANRFGLVQFPQSSLFLLPPGEVEINVSLSGGVAGSGVRLEYRPRLESVY